jgi:NitT/TauT family transport system ATP-binding protein
VVFQIQTRITMETNIFKRKLDQQKSAPVEIPTEEPVTTSVSTVQSVKVAPTETQFVNTYEDKNVIELKKRDQKYEKINIIDLVNIRQEYDVILQAAPGKTDSSGNKSMFVQPAQPKPTKGKNVVFDNFNMSVKDIESRGQFTTILGKSGCGKSTILRYICGVQKPTSGEIYLHGKKLQESDRIPMVFQQYSSFPWMTVLENVALPLTLKNVPKQEVHDRAIEMIKIVGLAGHESKFAKYPTLSGGQLQRIAIARNLVADPTILLMDEPFGALDIINRRSMQVLMRKIFQENNGVDPTVVLVTHDIRESIFLSSNILILDANPATVRCNIEVDLPLERDISLKRDPKFLEYVNYIEDMMEKIEKE